MGTSQKRPCKNYELATDDFVEDEDEVTDKDSIDNNDVVLHSPQHGACDNAEHVDSGTGTESLADKFVRISGKRLTRALYELKLMAQFGRLRKQYDWTQEQADAIVLALKQAVDKVEQQLRR
jgi:hypothetical protein